MFFISGATGNVGSQVARRLAAKGLEYKAMTRSADAAKANLPRESVIVEADFLDGSTLERELSGASALVLISPAHPQMVSHQVAVLDAASRAGVRDVVKLSGLGAALDAPIRLPRHHAEIEAYAADLGLRVTAVRPNLFMQVLLGSAGSIQGDGAIYAPAGNGAISFTDVRDVADVIVAVLENEELRGKAWDISGPEAIAYGEAASRIARIVGLPVKHVDVPDDVARASMLSAGMDPWVVEAFIELFGIYRAGYGSGLYDQNVQAATGVPARSFDAFVHDFKAHYARSA